MRSNDGVPSQSAAAQLPSYTNDGRPGKTANLGACLFHANSPCFCLDAWPWACLKIGKQHVVSPWFPSTTTQTWHACPSSLLDVLGFHDALPAQPTRHLGSAFPAAHVQKGSRLRKVDLLCPPSGFLLGTIIRIFLCGLQQVFEGIPAISQPCLI